MFCTNCGHNLSTDDVFCPNCGIKVEGGMTENNESATPVFVPNQTDLDADKVLPKVNVPFANPTAATGKSKTPSPKPKVPAFLQKKQIITYCFWLVLLGLYVAINLVFQYALRYDDGIQIASLFDSNTTKNISLFQMMEYMYKGTETIPPTAISISLSLLVYVPAYALPVFSFIMIIGVIASKTKKVWHTAASVFMILSSAVLLGIVPLALRFVPVLLNIIVVKHSILQNDVGAVTYTPLIISAIAIMVLVIASCVILSVLLRRLNDEKEKSAK